MISFDISDITLWEAFLLFCPVILYLCNQHLLKAHHLLSSDPHFLPYLSSRDGGRHSQLSVPLSLSYSPGKSDIRLNLTVIHSALEFQQKNIGRGKDHSGDYFPGSSWPQISICTQFYLLILFSWPVHSPTLERSLSHLPCPQICNNFSLLLILG